MPEQPIAYVQIRDPEGRWSRMPIHADRVIIGRAADAQVRLDRPSISRQHAELSRDPFGRWVVRDLNSRSGVMVKGQMVKQAVLRFGDKFELGRFTLKLWNLRPINIQPRQSQPKMATVAAPDDAGEVTSTLTALTDAEPPKIDTMHLSTLTEFGQRLSEIEDAEERLRTLCRFMVRKDFHGLSAMALRVDKGRPNDPLEVLCEPQIARGWSAENHYVSRSIIRTVHQSRTPVLASSMTSDTGVIEMSISPEMESGAIAAVGCPLNEDEDTIDVLYVSLPPEYGTAEWLAIVALAATQYQQAESIWLARQEAQNHAAIEQDLRSARHIQERLVPQRIVVANIDLAVRFQPCEWVGGDYVDAAVMRDGRLFVTVADVSGHGLPAALIALSMHSMVHTYIRTRVSLAEMVTGLNEHLCEFLEEQKFATMVAMIIDPQTGEFECVNAGHPPAIVFAPSGEARALQGAAHLPLGIQPFDVETQRGVIESGHLLAMYSDGLTEILNDKGRLLGSEGINDQLARLIKRKRDAAAADITTDLFSALQRFESNLLPQDDRSCLVARWTNGAA